MDFEFIREQTPLYIEAAKLTLHMAVIGVILAIIVGLVCSMIKYFRIPVLRQIVECYIELSRNTPLLIQLFFLYFGLPKIGIVLSSEQCAISGLAFLGGSYMAEAFRSGLDNVPPIQVESALSLGMSNRQVFTNIILPQAVKNILPALCNEFISLLKETSISGYIGLMDLTKGGDIIRSVTYEAFMPLIAVAVIYLLMVVGLSKAVGVLERKLRNNEQ